MTVVVFLFFTKLNSGINTKYLSQPLLLYTMCVFWQLTNKLYIQISECFENRFTMQKLKIKLEEFKLKLC